MTIKAMLGLVLVFAITAVYLRNAIRCPCNTVDSTTKVEDIYGPKKETLLMGVREMTDKTTSVNGIVSDRLGIIDSTRPPTVKSQFGWDDYLENRENRDVVNPLWRMRPGK